MPSLKRLRPLAVMSAFAILASTALLSPAVARAADNGQDDLDKATQLKLGAQSTGDFSEVIQLCESALKKGLDKGNSAFANDLMASALVQRGSLGATKAFRAAASQGNWQEQRKDALADLEKGVKANPKQPQAQYLIARLNLMPAGDAKQAADALDRAIALSDDDAAMRAEALVLRASTRKSMQQRLGDLDEAVRALPGNASVLRARGATLADLGRYGAAMSDLDKSAEADPGQSVTYQLKAMVLIKMQKFDDALAALEKGHSADPNNVEFPMTKAQIMVSQSNFKGALDEVNKALTTDASNLGALGLRAALYQRIGEKAKALSDIEKILAAKPTLTAIMRDRAVLLADLGKLDAAVEQLEKLHKLEPQDSLTTLQLGMLFTAMKKYDKAIPTFTIVLAEHPDDVEALHGRGDALLNLGRRTEAVADYERAVSLKPHDVGVLNNFAWVLATAPEDKLRDGKRAVALATDACRQTEYKADYILSTLAAAFAESGDFESAGKWAAKAVELATKDHAAELKKEVDSYKAEKPWRENLPVDDKKDEQKSNTKSDDAKPTADGTTTSDEEKKELAEPKTSKKK